MRILRALHKWFGLIIGIQVLLWVGSGLLMSMLDHHAVMGHSVAHPLPSPMLGRTSDLVEPSTLPVEAVTSLRLRPLLDGFVYEVGLPDGAIRLFDAADGRPVAIGADLARAIAVAGYGGEGGLAEATILTAPVQDLRKHEGPVWRVEFTDAESTAVYVDALTGRILAHRTDTWRLFDIAWMLHIMDYTEREDFNHPLIIAAGIGFAWLALGGMLLLPAGLARDPLFRRTPARVPVTVGGGGLAEATALDLPAGQSWFEALAAQGVPVPSECGGVGDCGRCRIVLDPAPPPTEADRRRIPARRLDQGLRLACRHDVAAGTCARLPETAPQSQE